jgi:hypothetical protein
MPGNILAKAWGGAKMAIGARSRGTPDASGFGKRGNVRLTPQMQAAQAAQPAQGTSAAKEPAGGFGGAFSSIPNPLKWAGGGLAVLALSVMLSAGTGGGGFLGGLLGGMLANRLMQSKAPAAAPHVGSTSAAAASHSGGSSASSTTSVNRGGFGATAGAHGGSSSG